MSTRRSPFEAPNTTLSSCAGCGGLISLDCRCQFCQQSMHCFCSAMPGEGHGDHYVFNFCHSGNTQPTGTGQETPEASPQEPAAAATSSKKRKTGAANAPKSTHCKSKVQSHLSVKKRVKATWAQLFHILEHPDQRVCLAPEAPNNHIYYGTVVGGNSQKGWDVQYDILSAI